MPRHTRAHFVALGVLPVLNAMALLLHGLSLATRGGRGEHALPLLIALALASLLFAAWAAVQRGRDLGWPAWITLAGCVLSFVGGPLLLVLMGWLAFARSRSDDAPPAAPPRPATWAAAAAVLLLPWVVMTGVSRL